MARRSGRSASGNRLERWQTLLAAAVTALAAIVVAVIAARSGGSGRSSDQSTSSQSAAPSSDAEPGSVTIGSVTLLASNPDGSLMRIAGGAHDLEEAADIYVVARPSDASASATAPGTEAATWLAAGPADRPTDSSWTVDFPVSAGVPLPLSFTAVVWTSSCPAGLDCAPFTVEQLIRMFERDGPGDGVQSEAHVGP